MPPAVEGDAGHACLRDAGGADVFVAGGEAMIGPRAATVRNGPGGGRFLSAQEGVRGGSAIADGAVIENATGRVQTPRDGAAATC